MSNKLTLIRNGLLIALLLSVAMAGTWQYAMSFNGTLENLPWYAGSPSPYSYMINTNSTHYFGWNGTTGLLEFGPTTNASAVFQYFFNLGGSISVGSGFFNLATRLLVPTDKGVVLVGMGNDATFLNATATMDVMIDTVKEGTKYLEIYDLCIQGGFSSATAKAKNAIRAYAPKQTYPHWQRTIIIERVKVLYTIKYGINLTNPVSDGLTASAIIKDCTIRDTNGGGIWLNFADSTIDNCMFNSFANDTNAFEATIAVKRGGNTIINNYCGGGYKQGIVVNGSYNTLGNNLIDNMRYEGILVYGGDYNTITGGRVTQCSQASNGTYPSISLRNGADNNIIVGVLIGQREMSEPWTKYGIFEEDGSDYNTYSDITFQGNFMIAETYLKGVPSFNEVSAYDYIITDSYHSYTGHVYSAINTTTGFVEYGPSTNASSIFKSIVKTNMTVFVKVGNYYIDYLIPIGVSRFHIIGENWGTQFTIGANGGFNISSASLLSDIEFRNILWHSSGGNANYMITSKMPTNTRISAFTFSNNRVQYFEKAGTIALDLCNLEVSFITDNFWYRTRTAFMRLWAYRYDTGNNRITGNIFYMGYNQQYENAIRLYTADSQSGNGAIGSIFSSNNQFFGEAYGSTSIAWNLTTYADRINFVSSTSDRYENTRVVKTTCYNSTSIISRFYLSDCNIWGEDEQIFIDFGAYTRISVVKNNAFELYNAAGTFVRDLSSSTTEYNRYENNQFRGTANFTSAYTHYWSGNFGTGFLETLYKVKTSGIDAIRMNGQVLCLFAPVYNSIGNNTVWTVGTNDVYISTSGGTILNITVYNLNDEAVGVFSAHVTALRIPFHWKFSISYSVLPVLKLNWVN